MSRYLFSRTAAVVGAVAASSFATYTLTRAHLQSNLPSDWFPNESTTKLHSISTPQYATPSQLQHAIRELRDVLGDTNVVNTPVVLEYHTRNEFNPHEPKPHEKPKYVIYPRSTNDVSEAMAILNRYRVPVVPFSGGTSLEGHFYSTREGIVMDTSKMDQVLAINSEDLDVQVQAGVNWVRLNEQLAPHQLMIGSDCGPDGLISGMINTNASGINASKYGAMISNVISLTVVLPDGKIVRTKQRPRKSSSGYSLTQLFVGSEGTLGIVTEATLKLHPIPRYETVIVGQFPTLLDSTKTVSQLYRAGVHPNAIELLDRDMMHCINYSGYFTQEWAEVPTLFFKVGGMSKAMVDEQVKVLKEISVKNNCKDFIAAKSEEEGKELFSARKNAFYAILNYGRNEIDPDIRLWVTDIAVPLSKLPPVLDQIYAMIRESGFQSVILAHAGDANFHCDVFYKDHEKDKCESLINKMMDLGLVNEGTASGEHGIGNGKRTFLIQELGQDAVDLMRRIKLAVDPNRILNPDKIFKIDPNDKGEF
ncbi:FAD/FMN-containing dehydrogenase [Yamadazyma tenuis]|nr:FAD/FMN-containing dehydrogenase [Yamadazyma tenuis]